MGADLAALADWLDPPKTEAKWSTPGAMAIALDPGYRMRDHLQYLSDRLAKAVADVEAGHNRYLTVSMPPRMGKSVMSSTNLPAYVLHRYPSWKIGLLSHSPTLAAGWGRQVRRLIETNDVGVKLATDAGAVTDWQTTEGGGVTARSVGQATTGLGFKVLLLDDVVKDFVAAHSENQRNALWDWWTVNSRTRLEPPHLVVAIGTRWHEDDLLGRLLSVEHEGDPGLWEDIKFPAIAEDNDVLGRAPGDPLYSPILTETRDQALARWTETESAVGSYAWAALYQQRPAPSKGAIFDADWWNYYDSKSIEGVSFSRVITSWDCAFKGTDGSDYVVGQKWGTAGPNRYLLDQVRGRWSFTQTLAKMREFCRDTIENLVEDKANGTAVIDVLKTEIPGMIPVNPTNSKEARARAVTAVIEAGNVWLPSESSFTKALVDEARAFPSGAHDDQVDALTQALTRLRGGDVAPVVGRRWRDKQLPA